MKDKKKKIDTSDICMLHGCHLNENDECDICMEALLMNDELDTNSLEDYDDIQDTGEEFDY